MPERVSEELWKRMQEGVFYKSYAQFRQKAVGGDWPGHPQREMTEWMPKAIQEKFGEIEFSMISGE